MYFALAITYLLELYLDYAAKKQYGHGTFTNEMADITLGTFTEQQWLENFEIVN